MTKEEIALQLTIEFKTAVPTEHTADDALTIATFYNTILENIKTE
jgi:hypothetical protein